MENYGAMHRVADERERADAWVCVGLSAVEIRLYEALLSLGTARSTDLAARTGSTPEDVRAAIDSLTAAGLVRCRGGFLEAIRPDVALEALLARSHERVAVDVDHLAVVRREASRLTDAFIDAQTRSHPEYIEVIEGIGAIQQRLSELTTLTRTEFLCMTHSATVRLAETSEPMFDHNRAAARRGVVLRTILPDAVADDPGGWGYAEALSSLGDQIRTCPVVPILANIADRSAAVVPLDLRDTCAGALYVRSPALVAGLVSLFELLWDSGRPLSGGAPELLDTQDSQLLHLLDLGAKDEHIARAMGISVRSVRARVARLMRMTDSRSRFQLATAAARRGWVGVASD